MQLEILTRTDIKELENLLAKLLDGQAKIIDKLSIKENETLGSSQIMERLKISYSVFLTRTAELTTFDLYKDGQWKMKSSDLDRYIEYKMNN